MCGVGGAWFRLWGANALCRASGGLGGVEGALTLSIVYLRRGQRAHLTEQ